MRVALIHHRLSRLGGLESRMSNYMAYFLENQHEVSLFCYKKDPSFHIPKGVTVHQVSIGFAPKHLRRFAFDKQLQKVFNKNDFDFSLSMERTSHQHASIAPGDHLGFMKALNIHGWRPKHKVQVKMDRQCFEGSDVIFPCSDMIAHNLTELYKVPKDKLLPLYPPLNTEKFNVHFDEKLRAEWKRKFNIAPGKQTFVMASVSHKRKGVPFAVSLFKQLPADKFELKVAGLPKMENPAPNIEFLGYVENSAELFASADFLIHPALFEPAGQIVSESLACGTPVIISDRTGWAPRITSNLGQVVKGFATEAWLDAIFKMDTHDFEIPADFAIQYGLTLNQHMEKMLSFYEQRTRTKLNR